MKKNQTLYCGTSTAAQQLGLSVGTIQKLVDNNQLKSWKTSGKHRRILISSIQDYLERCNPIQKKSKKIIFISEQKIPEELKFKSIEIIQIKSGLDALLRISKINPCLIIVDNENPNIYGLALIDAIHKNSSLDFITIITNCSHENVSTNKDRINSFFLSHPITAMWLAGFILAYELNTALSTSPTPYQLFHQSDMHSI